MNQLSKITILIPCHNEEKGIGTVIDTVPLRFLKKMGYKTEIIVINNNSTDRTAQVAMKRKVTVIVEGKKGKGNAMITGFHAVSADTEIIVMLDGDNTYKSSEIPRLIEPLMNNFCDVVVGSRLGGKMKKNSLKIQNRIVNWGYTFLVRQFYRTNITDVLSGYFAWKKEAIDILVPHLVSEGFEIEMEMLTKMEKLGFEVYSVPITYDQREGNTKIEAVRDGLRILTIFLSNLTWSPEATRSKRLIGSVLQRALNLL